MKVKLPVTWEMCGTVELEADSIGNALVFFDPDEQDIPSQGVYVDGSLRLTSTDPEEVKLYQ